MTSSRIRLLVLCFIALSLLSLSAMWILSDHSSSSSLSVTKKGRRNKNDRHHHHDTNVEILDEKDNEDDNNNSNNNQEEEDGKNHNHHQDQNDESDDKNEDSPCPVRPVYKKGTLFLNKASNHKNSDHHHHQYDVLFGRGSARSQQHCQISDVFRDIAHFSFIMTLEQTTAAASASASESAAGTFAFPCQPVLFTPKGCEWSTSELDLFERWFRAASCLLHKPKIVKSEEQFYSLKREHNPYDSEAASSVSENVIKKVDASLLVSDTKLASQHLRALILKQTTTSNFNSIRSIGSQLAAASSSSSSRNNNNNNKQNDLLHEPALVLVIGWDTSLVSSLVSKIQKAFFNKLINVGALDIHEAMLNTGALSVASQTLARAALVVFVDDYFHLHQKEGEEEEEEAIENDLGHHHHHHHDEESHTKNINNRNGFGDHVLASQRIDLLMRIQAGVGLVHVLPSSGCFDFETELVSSWLGIDYTFVYPSSSSLPINEMESSFFVSSCSVSSCDIRTSSSSSSSSDKIYKKKKQGLLKQWPKTFSDPLDDFFMASPSSPSSSAIEFLSERLLVPSSSKSKNDKNQKKVSNNNEDRRRERKDGKEEGEAGSVGLRIPKACAEGILNRISWFDVIKESLASSYLRRFRFSNVRAFDVRRN